MNEPTDYYIIIGHGWNLDSTIDLDDYNCEVTMLSAPLCLYEKVNFKHKQILTKFIDTKSPKRYLRTLWEESKISNDFCNFKHKCPQLLLTLMAKGNESNFLQKVGALRGEKIDIVFLLSDLLEILHKKGRKFRLIVYACRCPLDHFQFDNLDAFGIINRDVLKKFIVENEINILADNDQGSTYPCEAKLSPF
jgi:hypothetical protein